MDVFGACRLCQVTGPEQMTRGAGRSSRPLARATCSPAQGMPHHRGPPILPLFFNRRVMYAARSKIDHGPVENSQEGMRQDAAVLEAELDVDQLCPP